MADRGKPADSGSGVDPTGQFAARGVAEQGRLAFDGIHVLSPDLLDKITESGVFSVTKTYLRLAAAGADIRAFRSDRWAWHDIGTVEKLAAAEAWISARPD